MSTEIIQIKEYIKLKRKVESLEIEKPFHKIMRIGIESFFDWCVLIKEELKK